MRKSPARHIVKRKGKSFVRGTGSAQKPGAGKEYVTKLAGKSSFIASMVHSGTNLVTTMKNGQQYLSVGVSPDLMKKVNTHVKKYGSMGKAFHKYIRGKFEGKKLN